jgi:colicin import membrane protein
MTPSTTLNPMDRPPERRGTRGKWTSLVLALVVNLLFVGVLVFSMSWQNREPQAVTAELYAPPPPPEPTPRVHLPALKPIQPPPEPAPPKLLPAPPPVLEKPQVPDADIALKAKREAEKRQQELAQQEARRQEELRKQEEIRKQEEARKQDELRKQQAAQLAEQKRQAELKERQQKQIEAMRAQAAKEEQLRRQAEREQAMRAQAEREANMRAQAEREARMRAQGEQEARVRAEQAAAGAARSRAEADWINRIRARIRGNINLPPDIAGNPEAVFDVVQLPTGEILDVKLRKSIGVPAYDSAVQRAILKSSPLPKPPQADMFERNLELRFRPLDQ